MLHDIANGLALAILSENTENPDSKWRESWGAASAIFGRPSKTKRNADEPWRRCTIMPDVSRWIWRPSPTSIVASLTGSPYLLLVSVEEVDVEAKGCEGARRDW